MKGSAVSVTGDVLPTIDSDATEYLKAWVISPEHIAHPYPTEEEKAQIIADTGIAPMELESWFSKKQMIEDIQMIARMKVNDDSERMRREMRGAKCRRKRQKRQNMSRSKGLELRST